MGRLFHVAVTMPGGKVQHKKVQIGGANMTAEQLKKHYVDTNAFPGAESVVINPVEGKASPLMDIVKKTRGAKGVAKGPAKMAAPTIGEMVKRKMLPGQTEHSPMPGSVAAVEAERAAAVEAEEDDTVEITNVEAFPDAAPTPEDAADNESAES